MTKRYYADNWQKKVSNFYATPEKLVMHHWLYANVENKKSAPKGTF